MGFRHSCRIDINTNNPILRHVRCVVKASMKSARYNVYILLKRDNQSSSILNATCDCAAGLVTYCLLVVLCCIFYCFVQNISKLYACVSNFACSSEHQLLKPN